MIQFSACSRSVQFGNIAPATQTAISPAPISAEEKARFRQILQAGDRDGFSDFLDTYRSIRIFRELRADGFPPVVDMAQSGKPRMLAWLMNLQDNKYEPNEI